MMSTFPGYNDLVDLPTLAQGQADDLKVDTGDYRLWLSRCGIADGMQYEHTVIVEEHDNETGGWVAFEEYDADDPPSVLPGVTPHAFRGEV